MAAAIPAIGIVSYIGGPFLINLGAGKWARIFIYSAFGVAAGIWSYSVYDIPNRHIELLEAFFLGVGLFVISILIIAPIVLLKNRKKHSNQTNDGQD